MIPIDRIVDFFTSSMSGPWLTLLAALAATIAFAVAWRIIITPGRRELTEPPTATALAYLRSDTAPVVAALAGLRASGRITADGLVDRSVPAGPESDWFVERVLQRVARTPRPTVTTLILESRGDLIPVQQWLSNRGLMRSASERAGIRWGAVPALVVLVMGIGYSTYVLVLLPESYGPGAWLTLAFFVPVALVGLPCLFGVNKRTRAGRRLLAAQQHRLDFLAPARRPAFATYGPAAAATSAALFGTAALWAVDPGFATSVELNGDAEGGGASCGGTSCGGDGGGSGCGGGCGGGGCGG